MPESAEVKYNTKFLDDRMVDHHILNWKMLSGQYKNRQPEGFELFSENLPLLVEYVDCKGKIIFIVCKNDKHTFYIIHHLRMSGWWSDEQLKDKARWTIDLHQEKIYFADPRCLATLHFTTNKQQLDRTLSSLGVDILSDNFTLPIFKELISKHKNKNRNITSFMMDQSIMSGIGNYIKSETLYTAKVSPLRKTGTLTEEEKEKLFQAIYSLPRVKFANMCGFLPFELAIYGRETAKQTKTSDGRMTYWDPEIQK